METVATVIPNSILREEGSGSLDSVEMIVESSKLFYFTAIEDSHRCLDEGVMKNG